MKKTYLYLTVIGTILPNIFVVMEGIESGNYFLYTHPIDTCYGMFANNICSAFALDLLFVVALFLYWSYREAKKHQMKHLYIIWLYTFALGIAGGLPLFLYYKSKFNSNTQLD